MSVAPRFSSEEILEIGLAGYRSELRLLAELVSRDSFVQLLPHFSDYRAFLADSRCAFPSLEQLAQAGKGERFIDVVRLAGEAGKLMDCANLAAACEIFHGWTIEPAAVTRDNGSALLREHIRISGISAVQLGQSMGVRLNCGDTVRIVQLLKLLGLLPVEASRYQQLALCASVGSRDSLGFHCIPGIGPSIPGGALAPSTSLNFAIRPCEPGSLVLIDNDASVAADYQRFNHQQTPVRRGLHMDLYEGLDKLALAIEAGQLGRRNLVTLFRLEPQALPEVADFFDRLARVVQPGALFLATIGAGDSQDEFLSRRTTVEAMANQLKAGGMQPLRLKLFDEDVPSQGRDNPAFGISQFASFEALFCKLNSDLEQ